MKKSNEEKRWGKNNRRMSKSFRRISIEAGQAGEGEEGKERRRSLRRKRRRR